MRSDGSRFPLELTVTRIPLDEEVAFTGHLRDISDRLAGERERERLQLQPPADGVTDEGIYGIDMHGA